MYVQNEGRLSGFDSAFDKHRLPDPRLQSGVLTAGTDACLLGLPPAAALLVVTIVAIAMINSR